MGRDAGDTIAFAERVLALLDDGSFTATYKYAVLLGLTDLSLEGVTARGSPPAVITTRQLAEKVVELYWPHTTPYRDRKVRGVLRQNTRGQAEILSEIRRFRDRVADDPLAPLHRARRADPAAFERLVRNVEWKLIEMPLPRLQRVGATTIDFIYDIAWTKDSVRLADVRRYQRDGGGPFDNRITLRPGVGKHLISLNGLLRPLLQRHWAAMVARVNRLHESRLERFLFGSERRDLTPVRTALVEHQRGKCFYCDRPLRDTEVDHFIPWSRYPDDGLDNLVAADRRCNGAKRDFLAAHRHVERWRARMEDPSIAEIATAITWERETAPTLGTARAIYWALPSGAPLWVLRKEFTDADREVLGKALR
jgi:5-methylcytosine-specific restriction endonuclease McrA